MNKEDQQEPEFASRIRMSSIESFHFYSSNSEWPNSVISRCHFHGSVDMELAKGAWQHILRRQKVSTWTLKDAALRPTWSVNDGKERLPELAKESFHEVMIEKWPKDESTFQLPGFNERGLPKIAARDHVGFGLWCVHSKNENRATLFFACDHSLADGVAGMAVVREWMLAYNSLCNGADIDRGLPKFDWERWKKRSRLGLLSWSFLKFIPCQAIGLFGATKFIFRKFSTIEPKENHQPVDSEPSPGIAGRTISPEILRDLNDRAERLSVSENSLLLTIALRAMKRIRELAEADDHCDWAERKWIRLVLPIGIRRIADRKLPCTNKTSLVQIERTFDQVANADGAAQSIDREVRIIMGFKLDHVFLIAIRLLSMIPPMLRFAATNQKSRGTAVFTNLGEPFRKTRACNFRDVGGLEFQDFDVCGPLRSGTPINIAWSTFKRNVGDELKTHGRVSLHFDRQLISDQLGTAIVDAFEKELRDVAQFGGSGT